MSDNYDILSDVIRDRMPGTADLVVHLPTGQTFSAEWEQTPDNELAREAVGIDPRAEAILHFIDPRILNVLRANDLLACRGETWRTLVGKDIHNLASLQINVPVQRKSVKDR